MQIDEFLALIRSLLSAETDGDSVKLIEVMPGKMVAIKSEGLTPENREKFIAGVSKIPKIHKGLSYLNMADVPEFPMSQSQAIIVQAVGKAFGVWNLSPVDLGSKEMRDIMIQTDTQKMLPMNTGLNSRGVTAPKQGVSVEAKVDINASKKL